MLPCNRQNGNLLYFINTFLINCITIKIKYQIIKLWFLIQSLRCSLQVFHKLYDHITHQLFSFFLPSFISLLLYSATVIRERIINIFKKSRLRRYYLNYTNFREKVPHWRNKCIHYNIMWCFLMNRKPVEYEGNSTSTIKNNYC